MIKNLINQSIRFFESHVFKLGSRLAELNTFLSPKKILEARKAAVVDFAERAEKGFVKKAVLDNKELVLLERTLSRSLEDILNHPLCQKFLKRKPTLYIDPFIRYNAAAPAEEVVVFGEKLVHNLTPREAKGILGHEIAHLLQGDQSRTTGLLLEKLNQRKERGADILGAIISGEPEALKSALDKTVTGKRRTIGSRVYPSLRSRRNALDKVAEAMKDPEQHQHLLAELERRLEEANRHR